MIEKIEHYSISDMAYSYGFDEAFKTLNSLVIEDLSTIDLIALFPATKYLNDIAYLNDEAKRIAESNRTKIDTINKKLGLYFSKLFDDIFINDIQSAHSRKGIAAHTYIEALEYYSSRILIGWSSILFVLNNHIIPLYLILQQKKISNYFSKELKQYIIETPEGIDYLVRQYDENDKGSNKESYYLPTFTGDEIDLMVDHYLNYQYAHINVVERLKNHKSSQKTYTILPITKTKIKKGLEKLKNDLFDHGTVWSRDYNIIINPKQEEPSVYRDENRHTTISYGGKWIIENIDSNPTLLNNLLYVFELVDLNLRFSYLPSENSGSGLSILFENKGKDEYGDMTFHNLDNLSDIIFLGYYQFLNNKKRPIESLYEWFSRDYIKQEFAISEFAISLPIDGCTTLIKCKNLFSEIDKLLKSYMVFQKYGIINEDIYEEENLCRFEELKSLNGYKYIYPNTNKDLKKVMHLLFSDQSMLNYVDKQKEGKNFVEVLRKSPVLFSDYREHSQRDLRFLENQGVIDIQHESGKICLKEIKMITILNELYHRGFMDSYHLGKPYAPAIRMLEERGWLAKGDTLFSKQESDYLDYYLNNSKFSNSLALRNRYEHPVELNPSEEKLFKHYIKGLKVLGLIIIKINDEFCRKFPNGGK